MMDWIQRWKGVRRVEMMGVLMGCLLMACASRPPAVVRPRHAPAVVPQAPASTLTSNTGSPIRPEDRQGWESATPWPGGNRGPGAEAADDGGTVRLRPDRLITDRAGKAPTDPAFDPMRGVLVTARYVAPVTRGMTALLESTACGPSDAGGPTSEWQVTWAGARAMEKLPVFPVALAFDSLGRRPEGTINPLAMPEIDQGEAFLVSAATARHVFDAREPGVYVIDRVLPPMSAQQALRVAQCEVALRGLPPHYGALLPALQQARGTARRTQVLGVADGADGDGAAGPATADRAADMASALRPLVRSQRTPSVMVPPTRRSVELPALSVARPLEERSSGEVGEHRHLERVLPNESSADSATTTQKGGASGVIVWARDSMPAHGGVVIGSDAMVRAQQADSVAREAAWRAQATALRAIPARPPTSPTRVQTDSVGARVIRVGTSPDSIRHR